MRRLSIAFLLFAFAAPVLAQDGDQPFRLNAQDLAIIGSALAERPYKEVKSVIDKLQAQINDNAAKAAKDTAKPAEQK